jgi:thiol-disulfide isomerase/thioredoxin
VHTKLNLLATSGLFALAATSVHAGDFPDDYFYSGADRPAALRAIEGKPAPELQLDAWIGEETTLADLKGKVVVVDFWATWCGPCMAAIPKNIELVKKHDASDFAFIGLHDNRSGWDKAQSVVNDKSINYPVARLGNGGATAKAFGLSFWPTYVVIDRNGVIRAAGLLPNKVGDVVEVLLAEDGPVASSGGEDGEFASEWFDGGSARMTSLKRIEGEKAPAIKTAQWLGEPVKPEARNGRVTVIRFVSPDSLSTRQSMPRWTRTAEKLGPQGVVFIGICDHLADWKAMEALLRGKEPPFPIAQDADPAKDSLVPLGATATAYGVRGWPTTVVIDRSGRVRAAGVKEAHLTAVIDTLMAEQIDGEKR